MAADLSHAEAQEAAENNDLVTRSELQEMYPDKTMSHIEYDLAKEEAELELNHKIQEKYEFNEPRVAARQGRKTFHTGPKGVLTDHEEAKLKWRAIDIERGIKRDGKVYMNLDNSANETSSKLTIIDSKQSVKTKKQIRRETDHKSQEEDSDSEDANDDEDEAAMIEYKMHKMKLLEENQARYGDTKEVTAWTFEKEVDNAPYNVWVVMHVYQDYIKRCGRMNHALGEIAKAYPNIKFLRARSDRIGLDTYPDVGLPTFIVFKNGQQLQNHIAVHAVIGNPFTVKDVEQFLIKNDIIKPIVIDPNPMASANTKKKKQIKNVQNDDSDSELDLD